MKDNITIIGNDCTSGFYCKKYNIRNNNIFTWTFIPYDIYIEIVLNFDNIDFNNVLFMYYDDLNEHMKYEYDKEVEVFSDHTDIKNMPFCVIDDIYPICFIHYHRRIEFDNLTKIDYVDIGFKNMLSYTRNKYFRRLERMKFDDIYFLLIESTGEMSDEIKNKFNNIKTKHHKVLLTKNNADDNYDGLIHLNWDKGHAVYEHEIEEVLENIKHKE